MPASDSSVDVLRRHEVTVSVGVADPQDVQFDHVGGGGSDPSMSAPHETVAAIRALL